MEIPQKSLLEDHTIFLYYTLLHTMDCTKVVSLHHSDRNHHVLWAPEIANGKLKRDKNVFNHFMGITNDIFVRYQFLITLYPCAIVLV